MTQNELAKLRKDIADAKKQLDAARQDGGATQISFWAAKFTELLDQYPSPQETAS